MSTKANVLKIKVEEAKALLETIEEEGNRDKYAGLLTEIKQLKADVDSENELKGFESFLTEPVNQPKSQPTYQPATVTERGFKTIGEQFIESEKYKSIVEAGAIPAGLRLGFEAKGTIRDLARQMQAKATFNTTGTGLDTTVNYVPGIVQLEQQRLTVRDLLAVGQTTQNAIKWIKEDTYTNSADMTAEEGEKPEASFDTGTASADVKKIAVVAKVTDEMWADFPMLRDYINARLRFMVESKEEQQLLNGTGVGNQITGILQTSGIQTQAKGADSNADAIHKAMTKIRVATGTTGGFEPDGIVIHPTDYQILRLAKDANNQYYGGGYFQGAYGNGGVPEMPPIWGLRTVVTTAITAGTALVGAFRLGAQIWQREGIRVDSTNTNEDDFNHNRISLRVEERLALAVYRASAFCTVTSIA